MVTSCTIFIILLTTPHEIKSQKYIHSTLLSHGHNLKLKDYDIKHRAKSTQHELRQTSLANQIVDPSKYCRSFRTCHECVNGIIYPCNWCHNIGCSYKEENLCSVLPIDNFALKNLSCPFIYTKMPILIPSGIGNNIAVKINIPDPAMKEKDFVCQINFKYNKIHARGIITDDMFYCFPPKLVIRTPREAGALRVLWDGVEQYSNEIPVFVYRCESMASNFLDCSKLPFKYGCGWCNTTMQCAIAEKCKNVLG